MEVETYQHDRIWDHVYALGCDVLEEWLSEAELAHLDRTLEEEVKGGREAQLPMYRLLTSKYLTDEQCLFANRCQADPKSGQALPWPAPERVPEASIRGLVDELMGEDPWSPRAEVAVQLLMIAASIEVAHQTESEWE